MDRLFATISQDVRTPLINPLHLRFLLLAVWVAPSLLAAITLHLQFDSALEDELPC